MLAGLLPDEWPLQRALDVLARHQVYDKLLKHPEAKGAWYFTQKPSRTSARQSVDIATAITGRISGEPIPRLATTWLPALDSEWALEQTVSNIGETFEHYLARTVGALVNPINIRLEEAHAEIRLPATSGRHLRHGVHTPQALARLNAGGTSRRREVRSGVGRRLGHDGSGSTYSGGPFATQRPWSSPPSTSGYKWPRRVPSR
ncbi:hypothetical protein ACFWDI_08955 [Streptomyces sp. NPDC060064]|uniref:hypothetical protein n=1 Tax=Streptomyces sp. NPDC060064 TaxID=3347049 RepID=UPI00367704C9